MAENDIISVVLAGAVIIVAVRAYLWVRKMANLECLCIRCHANVDDVHRKNFSKGDNLFRLNDFNEKYPPKVNGI